MKKLYLLIPLFITYAFAQAQAQRVPSDSCSGLKLFKHPNTTISKVTRYQAGEYTVPPRGDRSFFGPFNYLGEVKQGSAPAFCRVEAVIKPTSKSRIGVEIWLPMDTWNEDLLGVGSYGWGGSFMYDGMLSGLRAGFVVANTDSGHNDGNGGSFIQESHELFVDYAYRSVHEMTILTKEITEQFYGVKAKKSYFAGCSLGGYQGLTEVKRYPKDYDGVIIGAPVNPVISFNGAQLWPAYLISKNKSYQVSRDQINYLHSEVMKQCGSEREVELDVLKNPVACNHKVENLLCKAEGGENTHELCFNKNQVEYINKVMQGPVHEVTGMSIFPGYAYGNESMMYSEGKPMGVALDMFKYGGFPKSDWDFSQMNYSSAFDIAEKRVAPLMHINADLSKYFEHGGKLIFFIGWADGHNASELADYYNKVLARSGKKAKKSARLFLIPGMGHCAGGKGCDTFNKLSLIKNYVESNKAPTDFIARKVEDESFIRERLICAYPKLAKLKKGGFPDFAGSFECK